jgi:hypothetical protein
MRESLYKHPSESGNLASGSTVRTSAVAALAWARVQGSRLLGPRIGPTRNRD